MKWTEQARKDTLVLEGLGKEILEYLQDSTVTEVYTNDDYWLRINTMYGRRKTPIQLKKEHVKSICEIIAGYNGQYITNQDPRLSVELNSLHLRAQLTYPPISRRPIFFLRKKPERIFTLEEYLADKVITETQYEVLCDLVAKRRNIVVVGATGSGKTTFLNALLKKVSETCPEERLLILEDTPELQTSSDDVQHMFTSGNLKSVVVTMEQLVFDAMRLSPDRITIGEVRDKSAYDVLKAWYTGHHGGFCTIHADNVQDGLTRLTLLAKENSQVSDSETTKYLIGNIVHAIVSIQKRVSDKGTFRRVEEIALLDSYQEETKQFLFKGEYPYENQ